MYLGGLSAAFQSLLPPLLSPVMWDKKVKNILCEMFPLLNLLIKANIPAMIKLLEAYVKKSPNEIVPYLKGTWICQIASHALIFF